MIQFYLLSVILNISGGYSLVAKKNESEQQVLRGLYLVLSDAGVRLALGILSIAVGMLKLLFALRGDTPVIGDFLPAISGIIVGSTLLMERYGGEAKPDMKKVNFIQKVEKSLLSYKEAIGYVGIMAGIIHFLFPMVLFL